jgi:hypothetical protein
MPVCVGFLMDMIVLEQLLFLMLLFSPANHSTGAPDCITALKLCDNPTFGVHLLPDT